MPKARGRDLPKTIETAQKSGCFPVESWSSELWLQHLKNGGSVGTDQGLDDLCGSLLLEVVRRVTCDPWVR